MAFFGWFLVVIDHVHPFVRGRAIGPETQTARAACSGLLVVLLAAGCVAAVDPPTVDTAAYAVDCSEVDYVTWTTGGESFFVENCRGCHSEAAVAWSGAPEYLTYDTLEDVRADRFNIRQAALWDRYMPPTYPLSESNTTLLRDFLDCGIWVEPGQ